MLARVSLQMGNNAAVFHPRAYSGQFLFPIDAKERRCVWVLQILPCNYLVVKVLKVADS
jgi:hypothetical protein